MAAKGSQKSPIQKSVSKKGSLDAETFAFDIMSYILPLCGYPKEKIKSKERKKNNYRDDNHAVKAGTIVLTIALYRRDVWKIMFESRLKSSGLDTPENIEKYLKSFFVICQEFKLGDSVIKIHVSLAAFSEIMLFLNYKGVEFDFEQMPILWSRCFMELIAQNQNADELLKDSLVYLTDPNEFINWITTFVQKFAIPYGYRDDVSKVFCPRFDRRGRLQDEINNKLREMLEKLAFQRTDASENPAAVLPEVFESLAALHGDRESPAPPESCESSRRKEKESKTRSSRLRGGSNRESEGRPRRKTSSELELEESLELMNLSREDRPQKNEQKGKKPKDRKSY